MPNRLYVDNPAPARWRYGLMSVLAPAANTNPHWVNGVDFQPDACAQALAWPDPCGETPPLNERTISVTFAGTPVTCDFDIIVTAVPNDPPTDSTVTITDDNVDEPCEGRTLTVTLEGFAPVQYVVGGPPVVISAVVPVDDTYSITVLDNVSGIDEVGSLVIDAAGDGTDTVSVTVPYANQINISATVNTGPARDVLVAIEGLTPVVITTGGAPVNAGTLAAPDADVNFTLTDVEENVSLSDDFTITALAVLNYNGDTDGTFVVPFPIVDFVDKTFTDGRETDEGEPFTLYSGLLCKLIDVNEARDVIARRFGYSEPRALEAAFWTGSAGNYPALATDPDIVILANQVGIEAAVGQLEQELAERYGGVGVIHAPRFVMPYAAAANLIVREGEKLTTPLGTMWAFGGGYDPAIGPTGEAALPEGSSWMYATGQVVGRSGEIVVVPPDGNALDRNTNNVTVLAERTWVLTRDCITLALSVLLAESPPQTVLFRLTNQTLTTSGNSDPFSLEGFDEGWLTLSAATAAGMGASLQVILEQQDADGNWLVVQAPAALTTAPNYTSTNVGDAPGGGAVFSQTGRVRWIVTGTWTGVDISLIAKGED